MKIAVASDHAAVAAKEMLVRYLREIGHETADLGPFSTDSCDYPDYARKVTDALEAGACEAGILMCGTGIGMAMAANKVKGIRAAVCHNEAAARLSRQHNDANVLCMGARMLGEEVIRGVAKAFLEARFEGGRHARRVGKLE